MEILMLVSLLTYARCFENPICRSVCSGVKYCLENLVGVGFWRGGRVAIVGPGMRIKGCNETQIVCLLFPEHGIKVYKESVTSIKSCIQ